MNYLLVDDEIIILEGMEMTLRNVVDSGDTIHKAQDPYKAIEILKSQPIDIMFCDVDMPGMNGLKLADTVQDISEDTDIVFATGYAHYSLDAWRTAAQAFILKPVGEDELKAVIHKIMKKRKKVVSDASTTPAAMNSIVENVESKKEIEVMCFGDFEISYHGRPIHFARKKSKEMLAYLVDRRGAMISTDAIRAILWEEETDTEEKKGYVRVLANDIRKAFDVIGLESILLNDQNRYCVDLSRISCDYIDFVNGDAKAQRKFQQEYMAQYSWAESTLGRLLNMK